MMRGVGGVKKSIHQSWLAKGLGLGLGLRFFKRVQKEILLEEASTLQIRSVAFHQDNAPVHDSILFTDYLGIKTVPHPPYSLDRAPCNFWLFPKLTTEEMKEAVTKVIDTLREEDFDWAFQMLLERYNKCIAAGGDYFKGD